MKLKKFFAIVCMAVSLLGVTACGSQASNTTGGGSQTAAAEKAPAKARKVLVVYYTNSHRTEQVARDIAKKTGGDLFLLEPQQPYTEADLDYNNKSARVYKEHEDPKLQDVALKNAKPANWKDYDTVFVGYPIWWGNAAWPLNQFVKSNDFTGKTVIPFSTSASSGMGGSVDKLKAMAGGKGNWLSGMGFTGGIDDSKVNSWVDSLGPK